MRRSALLLGLGTLVMVVAGFWLYAHGQREADHKLQDLHRQLREAQADADRREEAATGGAPTQGPTDFPTRRQEPPAPMREFLRQETRP